MYAADPFELMGNRERVEAVASSLAFGVAIDGLARLVQRLRSSYRQQKVNKVRQEIDEETKIVEAAYKAKQAGEPVPRAVTKTRR